MSSPATALRKRISFNRSAIAQRIEKSSSRTVEVEEHVDAMTLREQGLFTDPAESGFGNVDDLLVIGHGGHWNLLLSGQRGRAPMWRIMRPPPEPPLTRR